MMIPSNRLLRRFVSWRSDSGTVNRPCSTLPNRFGHQLISSSYLPAVFDSNLSLEFSSCPLRHQHSLRDNPSPFGHLNCQPIVKTASHNRLNHLSLIAVSTELNYANHLEIKSLELFLGGHQRQEFKILQLTVPQ